MVGWGGVRVTEGWNGRVVEGGKVGEGGIRVGVR